MVGPFSLNPSLKWQLQSRELEFGTAPSARLNNTQQMQQIITHNIGLLQKQLMKQNFHA